MEEELTSQEAEQSEESIIEDAPAEEPAVTETAGPEPAPAVDDTPATDETLDDSTPKASPRRLYPTFTAGPPAGSRPKSGRSATEFKAGPFVVKGIEGRTVTGIFSVFGVLDTQVDVIHPGAFLKTIRERGDRALHLWQHDFWSPPTAVIREIREIGLDELPDALRAEWPEATGGVLVKREYLDTPRGNEILTALKAGAPLQMSFGYDPVRYDFEEVEDVGRIRHLREVRLWETSDVLWGANEATVANTAALSVPFDTLVRQLEQHLNQLKEGRRNAATDQERINTIARLAVELGGGVVGCELGQVLARFDVDVTIVEAADRLLPQEEPEASEALETAFAGEGIAVQTGTMVRQVSARNGSIVLTLDGEREISAERLLVATGRKVDLTGLGLETIGLDGTAPFLEVDEHMHAADGIWTMGDVTGKAMLTHVALYQSAIVAADILSHEHPPACYDALPRVTFTDPEVGSVGMTEAEAVAADIDVVAVIKQLPATFRGWLHGSTPGMMKLVVERGSGLLVGATAVGPRAGELLGLLTLAIHARIPLAKLRSMIYPFPTFYAGIGEAIGANGRGLATVIDPGYRGVEELDAVGVMDSPLGQRVTGGHT